MDLVDSDSESNSDEDTLSIGSDIKVEERFSLKITDVPVPLKDKYNPHNEAFFNFFLTNLEKALISFKAKNFSDDTSQSTAASSRE
jgi:hypothetical protein